MWHFHDAFFLFVHLPPINPFACARTSAFDQRMQLLFAVAVLLGSADQREFFFLFDVQAQSEGALDHIRQWSSMSEGWSMALLGLFMMMGALFMGNLLGPQRGCP